MKILVDADSCPVTNIIIKLAIKNDIEVLFVRSLSHYTNGYETDKVRNIYVDNVFQSADLAIINKVVKGDIVVTSDYGLAAVVLSKGAYAIAYDGRVFNNNIIDDMLNRRHQSMKMLRSGIRIKGPSKRSKKDDERFLLALERLISISMEY